MSRGIKNLWERTQAPARGFEAPVRADRPRKPRLGTAGKMAAAVSARALDEELRVRRREDRAADESMSGGAVDDAPGPTRARPNKQAERRRPENRVPAEADQTPPLHPASGFTRRRPSTERN